jgi:hypothetical protein
MPKFRKKPVVIEAVLWNGTNLDEVLALGDYADVPLTFDDRGHLHIHTLEGAMGASIGDWIIRGVKNEFYPCKPDIFAATYEPAE